MSANLSEPSRAVLRSLVDAHNRQPQGRFTISRAINRRGTIRVSHPECNLSVFPDILNELIDARLVKLAAEEQGFQVLEITLRGFDHDAHMEQPHV